MAKYIPPGIIREPGLRTITGTFKTNNRWWINHIVKAAEKRKPFFYTYLDFVESPYLTPTKIIRYGESSGNTTLEVEFLLQKIPSVYDYPEDWIIKDIIKRLKKRGEITININQEWTEIPHNGYIKHNVKMKKELSRKHKIHIVAEDIIPGKDKMGYHVEIFQYTLPIEIKVLKEIKFRDVHEMWRKYKGINRRNYKKELRETNV